MDVLTSIADNPVLLNAVREVVERHFASGDVQSDGDITDIQLGQMYRARLVGLKKVDAAFKEIAQHKSAKETPRGVNRAR